ncbi:MAG: hypothetical protein EZS28_007382 [Streblomastix strix]|uniref:Uncharacterized protein n=1 Tax=Streblomastix strix TaxID=222440 RepID=A0A5J4WR77_9EUKA|nr:MAG: hypothetical protein EZS28_007382 [Streblomastix strix]
MNAGIFSCWFEITQLNALSFYRVDVGTNEIGKISAIVGYLDGSQLSGELKGIIPFFNIRIFVLELAMIGMMFACCFLFRFIIASQPSGLSFLRGYLFEKFMNSLTPVFVFIGIGVFLSEQYAKLMAGDKKK